MMRWCGIICFISCLSAFSQTQKITVRKPASQADMPWHVTLCGMYRGDVKTEDIYKDHQLKISNNTAGLRIISFEVTFKSLGKIYSYSTPGDTLSLELRKSLLGADKKAKIYIDDIRAVSKNKDTLFLNPITLRVID